ncbi:hypothetical protein FHS89_003225 [Rubricella aquisinus]|uniref:Uncharacterized protein n=1 Tax=Rubricella aquisinus TaxID=2028108 RepID=A0A840WQ62_9RHOB|nr:hypothetical protein [Rubricella aquisinus]MBB5517178.1 hypothetical protein [Rubricella aquisinus]
MSKSEALDKMNAAAQANGAPAGCNSITADIDLKSVWFDANWNTNPPANVCVYAYNYKCVFNISTDLDPGGQDFTVEGDGTSSPTFALPTGAKSLYISLTSATLVSKTPGQTHLVGISMW